MAIRSKEFKPKWMANLQRNLVLYEWTVENVSEPPNTNNYNVGEQGSNAYGVLFGFDSDFYQQLNMVKNATIKIKYYSNDTNQNYALAKHNEDNLKQNGRVNYYDISDNLYAITGDISGWQEVQIPNEVINDIFRNGNSLAIVSGSISTAHSLSIIIDGEWIPDRPTPSSPVGGLEVDNDNPINLMWRHNGELEQGKYDVRYRKVGASTWAITSSSSSIQYRQFSPGTFSLGNYEWGVRTYYANESDPSPWSLTQIFNVTEKTQKPVMIKPINNAVLPTQNLEVSWQSIPNQTGYVLRLYQDSEVIKHSTYTSGASSQKYNEVLESGKNYTLHLKAKASGKLWGLDTTVNFTVDYAAPVRPTISFTPKASEGSLKLKMNNPDATSNNPKTEKQDLYRRKANSDDPWILLDKDLPRNGEYTDYSLACDVEYEYRLYVKSDIETSAYYEGYIGKVKVRHTMISLADNLSEYIQLQKDPERSFSIDLHAQTKRFAGRKQPVAEFGETIENSGNMDFMVDKEELLLFQSMVYKQETLLYRDSRGRKIYGIISNLNIDDEIPYVDRYNINFNFLEVYFREGINT